MQYSNSKGGRVTESENKRILENIVYTYTVLRAYPNFSGRLPSFSKDPSYILKTMPDFLFQNLQAILDVIEPRVVVEVRK